MAHTYIAKMFLSEVPNHETTNNNRVYNYIHPYLLLMEKIQPAFEPHKFAQGHARRKQTPPLRLASSLERASNDHKQIY